ncbi:MAG: type IV pilus modification PilV family protein [Phycisphaerales bacterium]
MVIPPASRRGFLLAEVLVAGVILGVGLAIVVGLTGRAISMQTEGRHLYNAAQLADERLNLVLATGTEDFNRTFRDSGPFEAPFDDYAYSIDISTAGPGEADTVVCTVFWTSGGRERSLTIEARIAPRLGDDPDPERAPDSTIDREGA